MYLGIEIGGTKLQLAVGHGDGCELAGLQRHRVDPARGAAGILDQIKRSAEQLLAQYLVQRVGIGFGGPVDVDAGRVIKSHHVSGWDGFPLAQWCQETLGLPACVANDCDAAALAEARFGAGEGCRSVFYVTIGTGIGGGFVLDGQLVGRHRPAVAEIGHLRPGLDCDQPEATVESVASGWGIAAQARKLIAAAAAQGGRQAAPPPDVADLLGRCDGQAEQLTAKTVAEAASAGNQLAKSVLRRACQTLGWAIAQTVTLLAPEVVVVGGGVSLADPALVLEPLRDEARRYVFPPLAGSCQIVPAQLGETVVVHGALVLASQEPDKQAAGQ